MNEIMSSSDIMLKIANFSNVEENKIENVWKNVVSKIKNFQSSAEEEEITFGEKLANSSRVIDLKNGVLLVETDHPGWIQYLNFHKKFIIKGIKMAIPEIKISSLAFRVAGADVNLSEAYEKSLNYNRKKMEQKIDAQEEAAKKYINKANKDNSDDNKSELPPELVAKFDSIIKDMLTNSEN